MALHTRTVDLPYLILTSGILPVFLLVEWLIEWYAIVDQYDDWNNGPKAAVIAGLCALVLTHVVLTPVYLRRVTSSLGLLLFPAVSITMSATLVLLGHNVAPTCVLVVSLVWMAIWIQRTEAAAASMVNEGMVMDTGELRQSLLMEEDAEIPAGEAM